MVRNYILEHGSEWEAIIAAPSFQERFTVGGSALKNVPAGYERDHPQAEYLKLINKAQELGKERLSLLMQTICATGIRVSELKYITIETVKAGKAEISLKGKIRTILLTGKLCKKLLKYAKGQKITSGHTQGPSGSGLHICRASK